MSTETAADNGTAQHFLDIDTQSPLLEMTHITKSFPGVQALKGVSLSVQAGEVRAIVGENRVGEGVFQELP